MNFYEKKTRREMEDPKLALFPSVLGQIIDAVNGPHGGKDETENPNGEKAANGQKAENTPEKAAAEDEDTAGTMLPEGFSLYRPEGKRSVTQTPFAVHFADGAEDGIAIFHGGVAHRELDGLETVLRMILDKNEAARERLEQFFLGEDGEDGHPRRALEYYTAIEQWCNAHRNEPALGNLFDFSFQTICFCKYVECVKFGLMLLGKFDIRSDEDKLIRDTVYALGFSDELTFYSLNVLACCQNANETVFRLARSVRGWGRIFAIDALKPDTREIRDWMLWEGWRNNIHPGYSAGKCAGAGGFAQLLEKDSLTEAEWGLARGLMEGLIDEGPVRNISGMENGTAVLQNYLRHAGARGLTDEAAQDKLSQLLGGA